MDFLSKAGLSKKQKDSPLPCTFFQLPVVVCDAHIEVKNRADPAAMRIIATRRHGITLDYNTVLIARRRKVPREDGSCACKAKECNRSLHLDAKGELCSLGIV